MWSLAGYFRTLSPLGLVAAGAVAGAAGFPVFRKTLRSLAVLTVKGAMAAGDTLKRVGHTPGGGKELAEQVKPFYSEMVGDTIEIPYHGSEIPQEEIVTPAGEHVFVFHIDGGNTGNKPGGPAGESSQA